MSDYRLQDCNTFLAASFMGETSGKKGSSGPYWTETGAADPGEADPHTTPGLSLLVDLGLYSSHGKPLTDVWGNVTDFSFGATVPFTASKGSGTVQVNAVPDYEGQSAIQHFVDNLSARLLKACDTGNCLEYLVIWQPKLQTIVIYKDVNLGNFLLHGDDSTNFDFYLDPLIGGYEGNGTSTPFGVASSARLIDTFSIVFDSVHYSVGAFSFKWSVRESKKLS